MKYCVFWENIYAKCHNLARRMVDVEPKYIVAIGRGGLIPGVLLSHIMKVPLVPIMWQTRDKCSSTGVQEALANETLLTLDSGSSLLVVDDINDSGKTFEELVSYIGLFKETYDLEAFNVTTCALFERNTSAFKVDYAGEMLEDKRWIVFPWEME